MSASLPIPIMASGIEMASGVLIDVAVKGAVVICVAGLVAAALRSASAAVRHVVWTAGLVGVVVGPLLGGLLPPLEVSAFDRLAPRTFESRNPEPGTLEPRTLEPPTVESPRTLTLERPDVPPAVISRSETSSAVAVAGGSGSTWARSDAGSDHGAAAVPAARLQADRVVPAGDVGSGAASDPGWATQATLVTGVTALWALGALFVLCSLAFGLWRRGRLAGRSWQTPEPVWRDLVSALSAELGVDRPVRLLVSREIDVPLTWGAWRPRVVLPVSASSWSASRLRSVLLHELAHVRRRDQLMQLLGRIACAVCWFNPLVWWAAGRQVLEGERACDDVVLNAGCRPSEYAAHLIAIARSLRAPRLRLAAVPMARRSQLPARTRAILDIDRNRSSLGGWQVASAWLVAAALVVPLAMVAPVHASSDVAEQHAKQQSAGQDTASQAADDAVSVNVSTADEGGASAIVEAKGSGSGMAYVTADGDGQGTSYFFDRPECARDRNHGTSMNVDDDDYRIRITQGDCRLDIEMEGEIRFRTDDSGIESMGPDARFEIEERIAGERRRLEVRPAGDDLEYRWYVDGDRQPFDDEARAWFQRVLPEVFRGTAINAEARVGRILERGGPDAVLDEIGLIRSDHVQAIYFRELVNQGQLGAAEMERVVRLAGAELSSDHALGKFLIDVANGYLGEPRLRRAYVEAANSIGSDHEQGRVLSAVLQRGDLDAELLDAVLESAHEIGSDHEAGRLLIEVAERYPADRPLPGSYISVAREIGSDHQLRRVLEAALRRGDLSRDALDQVLELSHSISSDHEIGELLRAVMERYPANAPLPSSVFAAAETIGSDHELGGVLVSVLSREPVSRETVLSVLRSAHKIGSDHSVTEVLLKVSRVYPVENDGEVRSAYLSVAERIGSSHSRERALGAIRPDRIR